MAISGGNSPTARLSTMSPISELARERSDQRFSGETRSGHARRERLPQAGLYGSHRRWAACHSLNGRTQGATALTPFQDFPLKIRRKAWVPDCALRGSGAYERARLG